jgi:ABC-2 type transport system permease protein
VPALIAQVGPLAMRSLTRTARKPALVAPGIVFPLIIFAFLAGGLGNVATKIPGFPTSSYTTFILGLTFAYSGVYAVTVAGTQLGEDVQSGFIKRMALTRLGALTMALGQLTGVLVLAFVQALAFICIGLAAGAHIEAGVGGALLLVAITMLNALALGSLGMFFAIRTGSGQAVQALFPLLMALMFLSSMNLPRELISSGWFRTVATFNPLSYLIEAPRSLLVLGWNAQALELGALVAGGLLIGGLFATVVSLRAVAVRR